MHTGCTRLAEIILLLTGLLLWSAAVQAFSFCPSTGQDGWAGAYPNHRYYQPPDRRQSPSMPVMPFNHTPHPGSYYYGKSQRPVQPVAPLENQGLDYIMR